MSLKQFGLDRINAPETPIAREIRAQLRLSNEWKVVGMRTVASGSVYSDEYPDQKEGVRACDLIESTSGDVTYFVSQEHKDTYRCPCCHKPSKANSYVTKEYRHVVDKGYRCRILVNIPKLKCESCGHQ